MVLCPAYGRRRYKEFVHAILWVVRSLGFNGRSCWLLFMTAICTCLCHFDSCSPVEIFRNCIISVTTSDRNCDPLSDRMSVRKNAYVVITLTIRHPIVRAVVFCVGYAN